MPEEKQESWRTELQNVLVNVISPAAFERLGQRVLRESGFEDITLCTDGEEAWKALEASTDLDRDAFDLVITDVEMPRMDGMHLTVKIRESAALRDIPVILFSSIIE